MFQNRDPAAAIAPAGQQAGDRGRRVAVLAEDQQAGAGLDIGMQQGQGAAVQGRVSTSARAQPMRAQARSKAPGRGRRSFRRRDAPRQGGADAVAHGIAARQHADPAAAVFPERSSPALKGRARPAVRGHRRGSGRWRSPGQQVGGRSGGGRRRIRRPVRPRRCRRRTATLQVGCHARCSDRQGVDGGRSHGAAAAASAHGDEDAARVGRQFGLDSAAPTKPTGKPRMTAGGALRRRAVPASGTAPSGVADGDDGAGQMGQPEVERRRRAGRLVVGGKPGTVGSKSAHSTRLDAGSGPP